MRDRALAAAPFVLLATLWGFSFLAISVGLRTLDPVLFAAFRYDVGAVVLLGFALVSGAAWRPTGRENLLAILAGGVFLVGMNAFLFVGQQTVPSGVAAILQSLVPIATSLWALVLLPEERVSPVGAVGIALGFLGVVLIVRPDPANLLGDRVVGRLLIAVQVSGVALGGVLIQRARPTLDKASLSGWSMLLGGLLLHAASLAVGEPFALPTTAETGAAVGYLGVFATGLAFFIYFHLLEAHGAVETSLVAYLVPVVATIVGTVVLQERLTVWTAVGFLVVFLGFLLLKREAIRAIVVQAGVTGGHPGD